MAGVSPRAEIHGSESKLLTRVSMLLRDLMGAPQPSAASLAASFEVGAGAALAEYLIRNPNSHEILRAQSLGLDVTRKMLSAELQRACRLHDEVERLASARGAAQVEAQTARNELLTLRSVAEQNRALQHQIEELAAQLSGMMGKKAELLNVSSKAVESMSEVVREKSFLDSKLAEMAKKLAEMSRQLDEARREQQDVRKLNEVYTQRIIEVTNLNERAIMRIDQMAQQAERQQFRIAALLDERQAMLAADPHRLHLASAIASAHLVRDPAEFWKQISRPARPAHQPIDEAWPPVVAAAKQHSPPPDERVAAKQPPPSLSAHMSGVASQPEWLRTDLPTWSLQQSNFDESRTRAPIESASKDAL